MIFLELKQVAAFIKGGKHLQGSQTADFLLSLIIYGLIIYDVEKC
jgi:hypothetical protein